MEKFIFLVILVTALFGDEVGATARFRGSFGEVVVDGLEIEVGLGFLLHHAFFVGEEPIARQTVLDHNGIRDLRLFGYSYFQTVVLVVRKVILHPEIIV